jgi:hypothetical protein
VDGDAYIMMVHVRTIVPMQRPTVSDDVSLSPPRHRRVKLAVSIQHSFRPGTRTKCVTLPPTGEGSLTLYPLPPSKS